ncbi:sigma 54-interacting transcriptional regulator [Halomonas sp. E19]|uniref:sigma 54-interacting transcriptional regulator n=1 Tax=Halomonas sp. E19 TaxID=3397247 RepID=UPI0040336F0C
MQARTESLRQQNRLLSRALASSASRYGIVGSSPRLLQAVTELEQVSDSTASVLLLGESGTGKELFARALHLASPRREAPFIKVNCAAIPETLFESELFGYERGAFTGAQSLRQGSFEQADGGTLFLDEIGELPLAMQTKLLRTLQEGSITRLGGKSELAIDVRLVAATNRHLEEEVARGAFRQDLYYRLNVIPIRLPSLAERSGDIPALALHHLNRINQANQRNVHLTGGALERLQAYPWPGNIRELGNVIERMVLLTDRAALEAEDVERFLPGEQEMAAGAPGEVPRAGRCRGRAGALSGRHRDGRRRTPLCAGHLPQPRGALPRPAAQRGQQDPCRPAAGADASPVQLPLEQAGARRLARPAAMDSPGLEVHPLRVTPSSQGAPP